MIPQLSHHDIPVVREMDTEQQAELRAYRRNFEERPLPNCHHSDSVCAEVTRSIRKTRTIVVALILAWSAGWFVIHTIAEKHANAVATQSR